MVKPLVVSLHPGKSNISYSVMKKSSLHQVFEHLCEQLKIEGKDMGECLYFAESTLK